MQRQPELFRDLVLVLATRLRACDEDIAAVTFLPIKNRVARSLLELTECIGETAPSGKVRLPFKITQRDLAELAGVARENVNRIQAEWQRAGILIKTGKRVLGVEAKPGQ
jgi:CRP/FNR family cyclic AMP-dependent transcriptional regulator